MKKDSILSFQDCFRVLEISQTRYSIPDSLDAISATQYLTDKIVPMIKKSYRRLSMKYHPDQGGTSKSFVKIKNAYDQLMNLKIRRNYTKGFIGIEITSSRLKSIRSNGMNSKWTFSS